MRSTAPQAFPGTAPLLAMALVALAACAGPGGENAEMVSTVGGRSSAAAPVRPAPSDPMALGRADAPLVVVEFSDYQCPFCRRFHAEVLPELRRDYIDSGKMQLVFKDLPLAMHRQALPAAVAARCAAAQGKFWEMNAALFTNQEKLSPQLYSGLAKTLGLDTGRFEECRADPATALTVQRDAGEARRFGVNSTPGFLIGRREGERMRVESVGHGFATYAAMAQELDRLLATPGNSGSR